MEKHLCIVENSQPKIEIEEDKLNMFMQHFGITKNSYLSSTVEEKKIMLNKYYFELYKKKYGTGKNFNFFCFFFWFGVVICFFDLY